MASADFSQFVVTTANETACEISRDKPRNFPRLPARFTHQMLRLPFGFTAFCQLVRLMRLSIGFLSVRPRFRYPFFSPIPHDMNLGSRYRVRRQLRPLGLSPKLRNMPVIQKARQISYLPGQKNHFLRCHPACLERPLRHTIICRFFLTERPSPSRILRRRRFCPPLEVHSKMPSLFRSHLPELSASALHLLLTLLHRFQILE